MIVLLAIADSLRADAPSYASGASHTPCLDSLTAEGARFTNMVVSGSWTVPSILSMLTGVYPHRLGMAKWQHPYPARLPNLLTAFEAAGFEVACLSPFPDRAFATLPGASAVETSQNPDTVVRALRGRRGHDRFVLLHHWWTHLPYLQRSLSEDKWHLACQFQITSLRRDPLAFAPTLHRLYHDALSYFSEELLPRYLDAATAGGEDLLFVLTGDHGENWGSSLPPGRRVETLYDLHGRWITDETTRVPWVVWGRTARDIITPGQRIGGIARGVDLGPTIADISGVPWSGWPEELCPHQINRGNVDVDGRSLASCLSTDMPTTTPEAMTFSGHNTREPGIYPTKGPQLWRTIGLRNEKGWFILDGVDQERSSLGIDGRPLNCPKDDSRSVDDLFDSLESERLRAVDPGPIRDDEPQGTHPDADLMQRLSTLGYLD